MSVLYMIVDVAAIVGVVAILVLGLWTISQDDDRIAFRQISRDHPHKMRRIRLYLFGWFMFARAVRLARRKKHGAGKMPWRYALKMGAAYRWIVYQQKFQARLPSP